MIARHPSTPPACSALSREDGQLTPRGFPSWITIPSYQDLATGRRWHFFFAWLFVHQRPRLSRLAAWPSGHFRRDLAADAPQELRHVGTEILDHLRLRFPRGEAAKRYNVLQKLAYLAVVFVLLPLMILTGLTMSPGIDAALPRLLDVVRRAPDRRASSTSSRHPGSCCSSSSTS